MASTREKSLLMDTSISKKHLNILWLVPFFPFPTDHGGAVRIFNLVRHLSEHCHIHLFALSDHLPPSSDIVELEHYCRTVNVFVREPKPKHIHRPLAPPAVYLDNVSELHSAIRSALADNRIEIVQFDYPSMAQYRYLVKDAVTVLTEHDVTFLSLYRRFLKEPLGFDKLRKLIGAILFGYYELRQLPQFDSVLAMSEHDRLLLRRFVKGPEISVVPNGVDTKQFSPVEDYSLDGPLLFVGNFSHPPNVDAIVHFVRTTWAEIHHRYPDLKLNIVGGFPPPAVQSLANEQIRVCGWVPDVQSYYRCSSIVIVPIRYGSGTRIKILEAFAAGVPVISTSAGAEGLDTYPDVHYLVANSPSHFIDQIARLKSNLALALDIRSHARRLVENQYDWMAVAKQQMELYENLLRQQAKN